MLDWANLPRPLRQLLWAKCANHATHLENILCKQNTSTASKLFYGQNPPWIQHLKIFEGIGIVHDNKMIRCNLTDHRQPCLFIGYSTSHAPKVYKYLAINRHTMIKSRSTVWLQLSYGEYIEKHVTKRKNYDEFE
jgi:predicted DNA-binding transcriptional regulator AlpA